MGPSLLRSMIFSLCCLSVAQLEISELEEQKAQVEQQVKQLKEMLDKLQIQHGGGGGWR